MVNFIKDSILPLNTKIILGERTRLLADDLGKAVGMNDKLMCVLTRHHAIVGSAHSVPPMRKEYVKLFLF